MAKSFNNGDRVKNKKTSQEMMVVRISEPGKFLCEWIEKKQHVFKAADLILMPKKQTGTVMRRVSGLG